MSVITNDLLELKPKNSVSKHYIKLEFPDIKVSQCEYSEGPVGLTFIHFKKEAKVYMKTRGGWPGYIDCLSTNDKQRISGINISGGSLLGLESTTGLIAESLKSHKYKSWDGINGAIVYSGNLEKLGKNKNKIYPDKNLGRFAYYQNDKKLYSGQVGAGLSTNHGQGWAYKEFGKIKVLVLVVNNAIGSVYKNNKVLHYPKESCIVDNIIHNPKEPCIKKFELQKNTTIIVLITNLKMDNDELKQMNQQVNVSIGETIRPFNTFGDGDIFYTCSTEKVQNKLNSTDKVAFYNECSNILKNAILNSIKK